MVIGLRGVGVKHFLFTLFRIQKPEFFFKLVVKTQRLNVKYTTQCTNKNCFHARITNYKDNLSLEHQLLEMRKNAIDRTSFVPAKIK